MISSRRRGATLSRPDDLPTRDATGPQAGPRDEDSTLLTSAVTTGAPSSHRSEIHFATGAIISGRYRLVALLGKGGMGEVYRADDLILDQPVALKFLPSGANDESKLGQFHNELRIARQVSHKNVCRLYDLGEAGGHRFLTMEYIDGEALASLLRRIGRLPFMTRPCRSPVSCARRLPPHTSAA